jgi:hypothetical protein
MRVLRINLGVHLFRDRFWRSSPASIFPRALPFMSSKRRELDRRDEWRRQECVECIETAERAQHLYDRLETRVLPRFRAHRRRQPNAGLEGKLSASHVLLKTIRPEPTPNFAQRLAGCAHSSYMSHYDLN